MPTTLGHGWGSSFHPRSVASDRAFAGFNVRRHVIRNPGSLLHPWMTSHHPSPGT